MYKKDPPLQRTEGIEEERVDDISLHVIVLKPS
jgi:hypothetical protein